MNSTPIFLLKALRKLYGVANPDAIQGGRNYKMFANKNYANELIYKQLIDDKPCMIARFGATEMTALVNYIGVKQNKSRRWVDFVKAKSIMWWWDPIIVERMNTQSGFFPAEISLLEKFCILMLEDMAKVDILGSWLNEERYFNQELSNAKRVVFEDLEPFFADKPWTRALEGKKVLVVHPFAETIKQQYANRELIFENNLLPVFDLKVIKAVQSVASEETLFKDWFEALNWMKEEINTVDYDICIIGCGAYGFPLAAHVKDMGKKAIHLGGVTQLLFGIKGRRWVDNPMLYYPYINLFNENWIYPLSSNKPKNAQKLEEACYW